MQYGTGAEGISRSGCRGLVGELGEWDLAPRCGTLGCTAACAALTPMESNQCPSSCALAPSAVSSSVVVSYALAYASYARSPRERDAMHLPWQLVVVVGIYYPRHAFSAPPSAALARLLCSQSPECMASPPRKPYAAATVDFINDTTER